MFTVCVDFVFRSKYAQSSIICSLQYSININKVEVDPHSDLLHIWIVKPNNTRVNTALIAGLDLTLAPIAVPSTRYLTQM